MAGLATLDITPVNDAPTTTPVVLTPIAEDSGVRIITQADLLAGASDSENDALTATGLTITAGNGTLVDNGDGTFSYTPAANDNSDVSFSYNITDGTDNVPEFVTLDITPVNDAPVIIRDNLISNGDFSNGLADWTVTGTVFERDGAARFGGGNTPTDGVLSQRFDTIPGVTYEVSIEYVSTIQNREHTKQGVSVHGGGSHLIG